jgi:filamentous hemagglutinin family protein
MNRPYILLALIAWWGYALAFESSGLAQSVVPMGDTGTVVLPGMPSQILIQGGTQTGGNLFHQFQQFGLSTGQTATFQVNPSVGNIFGRVTGGQASVINGLLQVTGGNANLFLINPAGVIFGQNARLDLPGSFTATTAEALEFSAQNWLSVNGLNQYGNLAGNVTGYAWLNSAPNPVVNAGELQVKSGQQVMLSGGMVINTGTIAAPGGKVTIAAVPGEKLIRVTQDNQVLSLDLPVAVKSELSQNAASIRSIQLPQLLAGREVGEATGIAIDPNGVIQLRSGSAPIAIAPAQSIVSGHVTAPTIDVTGERIDLQEANLNALAVDGGGQIRVGGDFQGQGDLPQAQQVNVDATSRLAADAGERGNGGKVIVWSDGATQFAGQASAKGGSLGGNGGAIETSGKQTLDVRGAKVDASAPQGKNGEWRLDPTDINIANAGTITPGTIETALDSGTNVTVSTAGAGVDAGDITLTDSINQTGASTAALTLTGRRLIRPGAATINLNSTGNLTFNINAVNSETVAPASSIQAAVDAIGTVAGVRQINLAPGIYSTTTPIVIDKLVRINGNDRNTTFITGNSTTQVIRVLDNGGDLTLENTTIRNGKAIAYGGAIHTSGKLTVSNSAFFNNQAGDDGGAIRVDTNAGDTTIADSFFGNNSARFGGAIENSAGSGSLLTIKDSVFANNDATVIGGAIFNDSGGRMVVTGSNLNRNIANLGGAIGNADNTDLTISQSDISDNISTQYGGGIATFSDSRLTIDQLSILRNQANSVDGVGGGIFADRATTVITRTGIGDNTATDGGGAIYQNYGVLSLSASGFDRNTTSRNGGAIAGVGGQLNLTSTGFTNNQAGQSGGALSLFDTTVNIDGVGFDGNRAIAAGGAIDFAGTASLTALNSSFENSHADFGGAIATSASGTVAMQDTQFTANTADTDGGAIFNAGSNLVIMGTNSLFTNNEAERFGGAIRNNAGQTVSITDATFDRNQVNRQGGAIYNEGIANIGLTNFLNNKIRLSGIANGGGAINNQGPSAELQITNSRLIGNTSAQEGGAIFARGVATTIVDTILEDNRAQGSGGGFFNQGGVLNIVGSNFLRNQALNNAGGGISDNGGTTQITGGTIADNQALIGGGIEATASWLTLNNVTVENNRSAESGGGIELTSMLQTIIQNSRILNNRTTVTGNGAGLGSYRSPVTIRDTTVSGNQSVNMGGGLEGVESDFVLERVDLTDNTALFGGGISNRSITGVATTTITDSQILRNQATQGGGGVYVRGDAVTQIQRTTIAQNASGSNGGGIGSLAIGVFNLLDSTVTQNTAAANGGGIDSNLVGAGLTTFNIINTTVAQNVTNADGGGISVGNGQVLNIMNSTIAANRSGRHGGGINSYGVTNLTNVTIADNSANTTGANAGKGGGLFKQSSGTIRLNNTIVANNRNPIAADVAGAFIDQGNNVIGISDGATGFVTSTLVGTAAVPIDPLLASLGNYGGLTETLALLPGSRAIDAGNSAIATDQRGIARVGAADIGAFESRGLTLVGTGSGQTAQINTTFVNPLQVTVASAFGEPVDGGQIRFTAPTTGAGVVLSNNPLPMTIVGGTAQLALTANPIAGTYNVMATANGSLPVTFALTNTLPPVPPVVPPVPPVVPPVPPVVPPVLTPPPASVPPAIPQSPVDWVRSEVRSVLSVTNLPTTLETLDESFAQDYVKQFGSTVAASPVTATQVQSLLSDLDEKRGLRSAVIYAMFVPEAFAPQTTDGFDQSSASIPSLIRATERRDSDRLELVFITANGKLSRRSTPYRRSQVEEQSAYFWLTNNDVENPESFQQFGQQMQQWLFAPIRPEIEAAKINGLMYVLDQGLRSLPLAAMQTSQGTLLNNYTISVVPSLGMLDRQQTILRNQTTLAMGASEFAQLVSLPAVPSELAMIQQQGFPGQVLLNKSFTLANLMEQKRQAQPGILHLATHADFNSGEPRNSFIQFSDQQLTLDKLDRLGLQNSAIELLVLSACNTATGDPAAELGFTGMASLFGVRTAMGSLWSVSDLGTFAFMSEFYGRLAHTPSRADALRQTQLAMQQGQVRLLGGKLVTTNATFALPQSLQDAPDTAFTHPYYWSGFTMVGNPW